MIYLQLIILKLWNFISYFWKPTVDYNFWRLILHLITLHIYYLIKLIRILVTYWVVSSPPLFPSNFRLWRIISFGSFDDCVVSRKRSSVILGLDGLLIVLYSLANWHYVCKVWILFLLNYWRFIHKEIFEVFWI